MLGRRDTALTIALRSYQARHFSSCRKACQDVLDHDPRDAVALHLLGMSAFSEKNLDEAIGYLVEAASAEPSSLEIRTNLGLALRVAGRLEAAEEQFRLALSQAPDTPSLMNELALTLIDQERMGEADDYLWGVEAGYKALVYMACGVPPILSPVGTNVEIVEHGVDGFFARHPDEWIETITRLLGDPGLRSAIGARARGRVEREWSIDAQFPRLVAVLREVAA